MPESPIQEIVCLLGQRVAGNPTQFMMERAFAAAGLDWRYLSLEIPPERLAEAVRGLRAMGFKGGHVTNPHKVAVIPHLDRLSQSAELMGVVNCLRRDGEVLTGENTEGQGFVQALRGTVDPQGKKVLILGAGGTARALAVELGLAGAAEITIVNRTAERGQSLVDLLNGRVRVVSRLVHLSGDYHVEPGTQIVINATSLRSPEGGARVPLALSTLQPELVVADVTFIPPQTQFLRDAAARGCRTVDGLSMLVHQGVIAFQIWTGVRPDATVMREALEEYLEILIMGLRENLLHEQVKDLPLREAITLDPATLVTTALERMREKRLGCVIVVDAAGKPEGIFTEQTLIQLLLREHLPWDTLRLSECLEKDWHAIPATASVYEVLQLIRERGVRFVCVVDAEGPRVGLTGQKGLSEYIADHFPRQVLVQRLGGKLGLETREGA